MSVYITHPTESAAKKITSFLIERRVIACANLFPITSAYWWKGVVQNDKEWVSIVKTTHERWEALEKAVVEVHPYDVPCIIRTTVDANQAYEDWIRSCVDTD
ncbi:MAG: divalent-cation tolerance protein CutA [Bacteroidota bacterium]